MRYIIETQDTEGIIGMQIAKWEKEKKLELIEKGEPIIELKSHLEKVAKALEVLKKAGYDSEVMKVWLVRKTGLGMGKIELMLKEQDNFFKAIGILNKK